MGAEGKMLQWSFVSAAAVPMFETTDAEDGGATEADAGGGTGAAANEDAGADGDSGTAPDESAAL